MKILFLSHVPNDENAGASRVYHILAQGLRQRGYAVTLFHYEDLQVPRLLRYVVNRAAMPEFFYWRFIKAARGDFDIIFSSSGMAYRIFRELRQQPHRPYLIHHLHGLHYFDHEADVTENMRGHLKLSSLFLALRNRFALRWETQGAKTADAIVTQNLRDEDYLEDMQQSRPDTHSHSAPIVRVALPLHPQIEQASRTSTPPEQRPPASILWFGSWRRRKGNAYVNRAFREVKAKCPEATLTLGGTGVSPESVLADFDPDLRSSVRVLPRIDIPTQLAEFNRHALFIFPSLSEGFGFALIEAMAMGLACVTTHTGVTSDELEDREHVLIIAKASALHLAKGILRLIEDQPLRHHIAKNGQELAQGFTIDRCVNDYVALFESRPNSSPTAVNKPEA